MLNMRSVSFVQHMALRVHGKITPNCMVLVDIDGDKNNEFICCNSAGAVMIFKGKSFEPWYSFTEKSDVSCITAGDIYNKQKNCLLIVSTAGNLSIIEIENTNGKITHTVRREKIFSNACHVLLADVNRDDKFELLVSHSDCHVSAYSWDEKKDKLRTLQAWRLQHFAGNIAIHGGVNQHTSVMVSQPGCSYAVLRTADWSKPIVRKNEQSEDDPLNKYDICGPEFVQFTPLSSRTRLQNPSVTCQIIGDIRKSSSTDLNGQKEPGYFALCTLDGTIKLMEECTILWSVQVDHQLFAVAKMDVLGDNREEVIVCAWDGQTYILDHDRNVVRYNFHKNVQSFCAGKFSYDGINNFPSMAYADCNCHIYLYYDVRLPFLHASDLTTEAEKDKEAQEMFERFNIKTKQEKKEFLRYCLYEMPASKHMKKQEHSKEAETQN